MMSDFKRVWPTCTKEQLEQHLKEYVAYRVRVKTGKPNCFGGHDWDSIVSRRSSVLNNLITLCRDEIDYISR